MLHGFVIALAQTTIITTTNKSISRKVLLLRTGDFMESVVFTLSKALGLVTLKSYNNAFYIKYSLMILLPCFYTVCYIFVYFYSSTLPHLSNCASICSLSHFMTLHMGAFLYYVSFSLNLAKNSFFRKFTKMISEIDFEIRKCGLSKELDKKPKFKWLRFDLLLVGIGGFMFFVGICFDSFNWFMLLKMDFLVLVFAYVFPYVIASVVEAQFVIFIHEIAIRYEKLNKILEMISDECESIEKPENIVFAIDQKVNSKHKKTEIAKQPKIKQVLSKIIGSDTERYFVTIFRLHDSLSRAGVLANNAYSVQIVSYMTAAFVVIVFGVFLATKVIFLVRGVNRYLDFMSVSYLIWGIVLAIIAYVVLWLCCRAQKEAKRSALLVHEIMQKKPAFMLGNDIFYNRMKCFTLQFLHWENYFNFNGIGLFELDYTFIFSAISAATSYLIVLLQFDLSAELT